VIGIVLGLALQTRTILVTNGGDRAIVALRVGQAAPKSWSDDLLGFDGVIQVSRGREIRMSVDPSACFSDVKATYQDGRDVVQHDVNLCTVDRIDFLEL